MDWRMVGPTRGGASTAVAGHTERTGTFYLGVRGGGGIWKTTDFGNSWRPVSDGFMRTSSTIGSIRVAPSDPSVIYAGTGTDGIRSNVIIGQGAYRSSDEGESWGFIGLETTGQIGAIEVHPRDANVVYAAALGSPFGPNRDRGVYRTRNGGQSWDHVLFVSDSVGAIDLEIHPTDPETLYATMWRAEREPWSIISGCDGCGDGIWKSTDGGDSWAQVTEGLPQGLIGKIDLAVTPADPDRVYALVEAPEEEEGLYRSDDAGETWRYVAGGRYPKDNPYATVELVERPFYYTNVDADPTDADVVYVNNERFFKSVNGGVDWVIVPTPHGDNHDMWIDPSNPDIYIQVNDGGANVTLDGGRSWSTQHNQATAELYQVDVDDRFPYWLYAGQQDNTTIAVPSLPPAQTAPGGASAWWRAVGGCETGPAVPKPGDADIVYAPCKGTFDLFNMRTGQARGHYVGGEFLYGVNPAELQYRFQRTTPVEVSPHDPNTVYHGSQYVHRTRDGGMNWEEISPDLTANLPDRQVRSGWPITDDITGEEHFSTLYVIEESPVQAGVIWAGSNDGPVHVTRNDGGSWTGVELPGWGIDGRINAIHASHHDAGTAYVTGYRFLLNDFAPYVYKTTDFGQSWTRLTDGTNGIPADWPVRVVREDSERPGLLFAGTEFGMFVSFDDGANWQSLQLDLPRTPITDLEVVQGDLAISTMGRGFWILDDLSPLRQADASLAAMDAHLFDPAPAYRMRYRATSEYGDEAPSEPEYPQPGAVIDYYLGAAATGPATLEILDARGSVVRGFTSESEGYVYEETQGMRAPMVVRSGEPRVATSAGAHRFVWDLRHPGPVSPPVVTGLYGRPSTTGPLVAPGSYQVRLSVGDWSETRLLEVRIDPRMPDEGVVVADLVAQETLELQIRDALHEAGLAAQELYELKERATGEQAERLQTLWDELVTVREGSYPPPMLLDHIDYLQGMVSKGDGRPSNDGYTRFDVLRERLDDWMRRFQEARIVTQDEDGAPLIDAGGDGG
jgi:photosystem II stability/assembly factor-like uncharacterized protein